MRKATTTAVVLMAGLSLYGCDYLTPDPGKPIIAAALAAAPVTASFQPAFEAPTATCFPQGTLDTDIYVDFGSNGTSNRQKMSFKLDQIALINTLFHKSPENPVAQIGNQTVNCFDEEIRSHKTRAFFGGLEYDLTLGTAHVIAIEFINEFTASGIFGQAQVRSYKVSFTLDQEHPTGEGTLPTFTTTCLLAKDPVQNEWKLQEC